MAEPILMGKYYSPRDMRFLNAINDEFMNKVVQTFIKIYRVSADNTKTNIYNETDPLSGKVFEPGVIMSALIEHPDTTTKQEGFGSDRSKTGMEFKLNELFCRQACIYPVGGDVIAWNDVFFEIDNIVQEQHLGGQYEKSFSIICQSHATKTSRINVLERTKDST